MSQAWSSEPLVAAAGSPLPVGLSVNGVYNWWIPLTLCLACVGLGYMLAVIWRG